MKNAQKWFFQLYTVCSHADGSEKTHKNINGILSTIQYILMFRQIEGKVPGTFAPDKTLHLRGVRLVTVV